MRWGRFFLENKKEETKGRVGKGSGISLFIKDIDYNGMSKTEIKKIKEKNHL